MAAPEYRVTRAAVDDTDGTTITFTVAAWAVGEASAFDLIDGARHAIGGSTTVIVNHGVSLDGREIARGVSEIIANERASG